MASLSEEERELGPWGPEDEALFVDLTAKMRKRIKYYYRRNHPFKNGCDGSQRQSTRHLEVHHCGQLSIKSARLRLSGQNATVGDDEIHGLESQCRVVDRNNAVWYDADGVKLVHYFPHLFTERTAQPILKAFQGLIENYPPEPPPKEEKRSTRYKNGESI